MWRRSAAAIASREMSPEVSRSAAQQKRCFCSNVLCGKLLYEIIIKARPAANTSPRLHFNQTMGADIAD
jgi:hypothetical protein